MSLNMQGDPWICKGPFIQENTSIKYIQGRLLIYKEILHFCRAELLGTRPRIARHQRSRYNNESNSTNDNSSNKDTNPWTSPTCLATTESVASQPKGRVSIQRRGSCAQSWPDVHSQVNTYPLEVIKDLKDKVYLFFEWDTLFLECLCVLFLAVFSCV